MLTRDMMTVRLPDDITMGIVWVFGTIAAIMYAAGIYLWLRDRKKPNC